MSSSATEYLFRRDEVLQALYWMAGEGIGASATLGQMEVLLARDGADMVPLLAEMVEEGLLEVSASGVYRLTEPGREAGARSFALEFDGWIGQAHGDCGPDCACRGQGGTVHGCLG